MLRMRVLATDHGTSTVYAPGIQEFHPRVPTIHPVLTPWAGLLTHSNPTYTFVYVSCKIVNLEVLWLEGQTLVSWLHRC